MNEWAERAKFWRTIPPLSTAIFLGAVFCVFGCIGFLSMGANPDLISPLQTALVVLISGGFAIGYALAGTRHKPKAFYFLIPGHIAATSLLPRLVHHAAAHFDIPPALSKSHFPPPGRRSKGRGPTQQVRATLAHEA